MAQQTIACVNQAKHTVCPSHFRAWYDWAERMIDVHHYKQIRCIGCGRYVIWVPIASKALRG